MLLDPSVIEGIIGWESQVDILLNEVVDQVFAVIWDVFEGVVVEVELAPDDVADDLELVAAGEGHFAGEEDVEDDAHGPEVDLVGVVLLEDFGCDVVGLKFIIKKITDDIRNHLGYS